MKGQGALLKKQAMSILYSYCARKGHAVCLYGGLIYSVPNHCLHKESTLLGVGFILIDIHCFHRGLSRSQDFR